MKIVNLLPMLILFSLLILPIPCLAQDCLNNISSTSPTQHYRINNDGTVSDTKNKLVWMQCSIGQQWNKGQCIGKAKTMSWDKAIEEAKQFRAGKHSNWRIPTIHELSSLAELRCQQPAINLQVFPATPPRDYWTATSFINNDALAWRVHFAYGENHTAKKTTQAIVRLVRSASQ